MKLIPNLLFFNSCFIILNKKISFYLNFFIYYLLLNKKGQIFLNIICMMIIFITIILLNIEVDLCQPRFWLADDLNLDYESDTPPSIDMSRKPTLVRRPFTPNISVPELCATPLPGDHTHLIDVPRINRDWNNSSVLVQNDSIPSNIHELGVPNNIGNPSVSTFGQSESTMPQAGSVASNIHELPTNISVNSSMIAIEGSVSTSITSVPNNEQDNNAMGLLNQEGGFYGQGNLTPSGTFYGQGYLAPINTLGPEITPYDYTERTSPGTTTKIIASLDSIKSSINSKSIKYYGMGKRKIYWEIWEKHTDRYESYSSFKIEWDPKASATKRFFKDIKQSAKSDLRDIFYLEDRKTIKGKSSTYNQVQNLLNTKHPYRK